MQAGCQGVCAVPATPMAGPRALGGSPLKRPAPSFPGQQQDDDTLTTFLPLKRLRLQEGEAVRSPSPTPAGAPAGYALRGQPATTPQQPLPTIPELGQGAAGAGAAAAGAAAQQAVPSLTITPLEEDDMDEVGDQAPCYPHSVEFPASQAGDDGLLGGDATGGWAWGGPGAGAAAGDSDDEENGGGAGPPPGSRARVGGDGYRCAVPPGLPSLPRLVLGTAPLPPQLMRCPDAWAIVPYTPPQEVIQQACAVSRRPDWQQQEPGGSDAMEE